MVYCNDYNYGRWVLKIGRKEELFLEMEDAIAAAKAWLMEVEA